MTLHLKQHAHVALYYYCNSNKSIKYQRASSQCGCKLVGERWSTYSTVLNALTRTVHVQVCKLAGAYTHHPFFLGCVTVTLVHVWFSLGIFSLPVERNTYRDKTCNCLENVRELTTLPCGLAPTTWLAKLPWIRTWYTSHLILWSAVAHQHFGMWWIIN